MATKTWEIIDCSNIQSFSIKVTEEISDKYLLDFLRTSLENQQLEFSTNSKFYYNFIPSSLSYEIIYFEDTLKLSVPEPFIFIEECDTTTKELFVTNHYFCLFDSKQLLLYKDIKNILQEDIQTYIEQLYKIKIDKVTVVDEEKYELIKNKFLLQNKKHSFTFYSMKKENSFQIFLIFVSVMIVLFTFFLYISLNPNQQTTAKDENIPSYEKGYKKHLLIYKEIDKKPVNSSIELFEYLVSHNIFIEKLSYKNSKLNIVVENSSRKKLLAVMKNYIKNIEIQSIQFDEKLNKYKMDISIDVKK